MKKLFSVKNSGIFFIEEEGKCYSIYDCDSNTSSYYDCNGIEILDYVLPSEDEMDGFYADAEEEDQDGLKYNMYGVACGEDCLVDLEANEIPNTKLNCVDYTLPSARYYVFTLLSEEQCKAIDCCGKAEGVTMNYYDTKTRQYVLTGIPEFRLDLYDYAGEPEVIIAASQLLDEYDTVEVEGIGTILGYKDDGITVYDYYRK